MLGTGTKDDPYLVSTYEELQQYLYTSSFVKLEADLQVEKSGGYFLSKTRCHIDGGGRSIRVNCAVQRGIDQLTGSMKNINFDFLHVDHNVAVRAALRVDACSFIIRNNYRQMYGSHHDEVKNCAFTFLNGTQESVSESGVNNTYVNATNEGYGIPLDGLSFDKLPRLDPKMWEITGEGLKLRVTSNYFFSGLTVLLPDNTLLANRQVVATSLITSSAIKYTTVSDENGSFRLDVGSYNQPLIIYCHDKIDSNLHSNQKYDVAEVALPISQNGHAYTCTHGGTTAALPDVLPTSGTLVSGTAEFSISPLHPPVIYGPVSPARKA